MKKIISIIIVLILLVSLFACVNDGGNSEDKNAGDNWENNYNNENTVFSSVAMRAEPVQPSSGNAPKIIDSYTDGTNNYYLLDVGYIKNSYISTLASVNYTGVPISFSKTTVTASEIQSSITNVISDSYYLATSSGIKISIGSRIGIDNTYIESGLDWDWSMQSAVTINKSTENTLTSAKNYSESQTIAYSFGAEEFDTGWYRYALYGAIDVYYICVTSKNNAELISLEICACARENDYFVRSEYSQDGKFDNEPTKDITFQENFYKTLPLPVNSVPGNVIAETKYISTYPLSCKLDNKYNYSQRDPNADNIHFSHEFEFGKFVVSGGQFRNGSVFGIVPNNSIDIDFRLEYDADNLPIQDNMTSRYVSNDTKQSGFYDMPWNIGERTVGRGMIVALVSYKDGSPSDKICITDAFNNKKAGAEISIVKDLKKPCDIEIVICYELEMWAPGFLGIVDNYWMNWRINQEFKIIN